MTREIQEARRSLQKLADVVGRQYGLKVIVPPQADNAATWGAGAIHPLQVQETVAFGIVRGEMSKVASAEQKQLAEREALAGFAFSTDIPPRWIDGSKNAEAHASPQFPRDLLRVATDTVDKVLKPVGPALTAERSWGLLIAARAQIEVARDVLDAGPGLDPNTSMEVRATLADAAKASDLAGCAQLLSDAASVLSGLCSIQMIYNIQTFYLFRLLVRFRIDGEGTVSDKTRKEIDGSLTGLLNNKQPWLFSLLAQRLRRLGMELRKIDPAQNVFFFLKGGRALKYLMGKREEGENDWDTQVVINPDLPEDEWYALFRAVHNCILKELRVTKARFVQQLGRKENLTALVKALDEADVGSTDKPDSDVADPPSQSRSLKAELIDIGLPRRDTMEAREQWERVRSQIVIKPGDPPIPGTRYFVEEYLMMIRGVVAGVSSEDKFPKRLGRFVGILGKAALDAQTRTPNTAPLDKAPKAVDALSDQVRVLHLTLLAQFVEALALERQTAIEGARYADGTFTAAFDAVYAEQLNADSLTRQYWSRVGSMASVEPTTEAGLVFGAVAYAAWVSEQCAAQLSRQAAFLAAPASTGRRSRFELLMSLVEDLGMDRLFDSGENLEVRMAVVGAAAALLQARMANFDRTDELAPCTNVEVCYYCRDPDAGAAMVLALVDGVLQRGDAAPTTWTFDSKKGINLRVVRRAHECLLYWPDVLPPEGSWPAYAPLAMCIRVAEAAEGFPTPSYLGGHPLISLKDLILDFQRRAGRTEELGTKLRLKRSIAALIEIATDFDNPQPQGHTITALQRDDARYLQLAIADYGTGRPWQYPLRYYPDRAYRVDLRLDADGVRRDLLSIKPTPKGRKLDLLLVSGDASWRRAFSGYWDSGYLSEFVVKPMEKAGITASLVVLDFPSSASLIDTFFPLCAKEGTICVTLYRCASLVVDERQWLRMYDCLVERSAPAPTPSEVIEARLRRNTELVTGRSLLTTVNNWSIEELSTWLKSRPEDRDALSAVRFLPLIAGAVEQWPARPRWPLPSDEDPKDVMSNDERTLLRVLNDDRAVDPKPWFQKRILALVNATMEGDDPLRAALDALPLFAADEESLWGCFLTLMPIICARGTRLPRVASPYAQLLRYGTGCQLRFDSVFSSEHAVTEALRTIPNLPFDNDQAIGVLAIRAEQAKYLSSSGLQEEPVDDYLQQRGT